jgi:hypothetical protein
MVPPDDPSTRKKDPTTTRKPASGPTDRSIPPVIRAIVWPMAMKPRAVHSNITEVTLNGKKYRSFWV